METMNSIRPQHETDADLIAEALVREIGRPTRWMAKVEAWHALLEVRRVAKDMTAEYEHLCGTGSGEMGRGSPSQAESFIGSPAATAGSSTTSCSSATTGSPLASRQKGTIEQPLPDADQGVRRDSLLFESRMNIGGTLSG